MTLETSLRDEQSRQKKKLGPKAENKYIVRTFGTCGQSRKIRWKIWNYNNRADLFIQNQTWPKISEIFGRHSISSIDNKCDQQWYTAKSWDKKIILQ